MWDIRTNKRKTLVEVRTMVSKVSSNRATPPQTKISTRWCPPAEDLGLWRHPTQRSGCPIQTWSGCGTATVDYGMDRSFSASTKNGPPPPAIYFKLVCEYSRLILSFVIAISYIYISIYIYTMGFKNKLMTGSHRVVLLGRIALGRAKSTWNLVGTCP